jgi:hypothetical protein
VVLALIFRFKGRLTRNTNLVSHDTKCGRATQNMYGCTYVRHKFDRMTQTFQSHNIKLVFSVNTPLGLLLLHYTNVLLQKERSCEIYLRDFSTEETFCLGFRNLILIYQRCKL